MTTISPGIRRLVFLELDIAQELYALGMISRTVIKQYEIYKYVERRQSSSVLKSDAVRMAAEFFDVPERAVWRALKYYS